MTMKQHRRNRVRWPRLLVGFVAVYVLFQWLATSLGSDRGPAGLLVGAAVLLATIAVERVAFRQTLASSARALGLGRPRGAGLAAAAGIGAALLMVIPAFAFFANATVSFTPDALRLLPGLFAQAGVAEEVLFRGYLFGHIRRHRSFWPAAGLSMIPFAAVHLSLFLSMSWPLAAAALMLAIVAAVPLAQLFELGGSTIWPPALLHFVVQGAVKVVTVSGTEPASFPIAWIAASALIPMAALLLPRPQAPDARG